MEEQINILVNGIKTPAIYQGDFMLDKFCQLLAQHCTKREAYRQAYGASPDMPNSTLDTRIKTLYENHPEIPRRIAESAAELREVWLHHIYEGLDRLWHLFTICIGDPKTAGLAIMAYRVIVSVTGAGQPFGTAQTDSTASTAIDTSQVNRKLDSIMLKLGMTVPTTTTEGESHA